MKTLLAGQLIKYQNKIAYTRIAHNKRIFVSHLLECAFVAYRNNDLSLASCDLRIIYMTLAN